MTDEPAEQPEPDDGAHASARHSAHTRGQQGVFLEAFARLGNVTGAARETGVDRRRHYEWLEDLDYAARFADAEMAAADALIEEARRRALHGVTRGVYQGGKRMETVTEYSDTLIMFLLKGALPAVFRDNAKGDAEATGARAPLGWEQQQAVADLADEILVERSSG